jgi:LCP family protein required for cell wall assembly
MKCVKQRKMTDEVHTNSRKKILIIVAGSILIILVLVFVVWNVLLISGKKSLYGKKYNERPKLEISSSNMETLGQGEEWKSVRENQIAYNGHIYEYNTDILNFLVLGTDNKQAVTDDESGAGGQADANFLLVLNPDEKNIYLICINRDTMTKIDVYSNYGDFLYTVEAQLALAHSYGISRQQNAQLAEKAVSQLMFDLPIHGYCSVNMTAVAKINDAVGGVTLECLDDLRIFDPVLIQGNTITLQGELALDYVMGRDVSVFESSRGRLRRQKQYLELFVQQTKEVVKKNPSVILDLYQNLASEMVTDVSLDEVAYLASILPEYSFTAENVITLEGETVMGEKYEEFYVDKDKLAEMILRIFYREVE